MDCQIRLIRKYPFELEKQTNPMLLTYTCFTDPNTGQSLQIQNHGYRYIVGSKNNDILVFITVNKKLQTKQNQKVLYVPFNILNKIQDLSQNVKIVRKPLSMLSSLLPDLPQAKQINIYFNSTFKVDPAIISILSASNYVFRTGQYYLDSIWLCGFLKLFSNLQAQLEWSLLIKEHQKDKRSNFLRCYIQVTNQQHTKYFLFKNGVTKINIKQIDLHPYNMYRITEIDQINKQIYQFRPYSKTKAYFKEFINKNSILIIQSRKDTGIRPFLEDLSQNILRINFECIDCNLVPSYHEFYRKLDWISNLENSLILIRNLDWIAQLYQADQILNFQIKHIAKKIEQIFDNLQNKTPRKYILVVQTEGTTLTEDMFQKCQKTTLQVDKTQKMLIFQLIFNYFDTNYPQKEEIVQVCHDKFGWQKFKDFMQKEWTRIKHKQVGDILKQISKMIKQQEVQNLIEVSWDDVGGLQAAKEEIIQTILLPIRHPQIFDQWIKPRTGLLFYGPPGTGKTLLGKCIAKECKMSFISVKGPQLLNMYVGQSEKNVRQVFERAKACKPCIVFMDQLDALIPKRGKNSDSHQVMDRIVAELLVQMDLASADQVFIIGATNRPDLLDPSIMRPGRFDKQIYLGITKNTQDRIKILKAQTRNLCLYENIDWQRLLEKIPQNFTGADFYGLTSKAVMIAAQRTIEQFQQGIEHQKIKIEQKDFLLAVQKVKPSVSEVQLRRYQQLKKIYS